MKRNVKFFLPFCLMVLWCIPAEIAAQASASQVRQVQAALQKQGFDPGPVDGMMGPKTREAIRRFQRAKGLQITGTMDTKTLDALGLEARVENIEVPAGTRIQARLDDYLTSDRANVGDTFDLTVAESVAVGSRVVIPRGTRITGKISEVERAKRPQKGGKLVLRATSIRLPDGAVGIDGEITAEGKNLKGEGSLKEDLKEIGIGAAAGGIIGGLIKGGKGALIGVLIGGGGTFLGTKGEEVKLPPETQLIVDLKRGVRIPVLVMNR